MGIKEIQAKSILIKRPRVDSWFLAGYGMNLYRGCVHACAYCDGQAESYRVEGVFGQDVGVKINALQLLRRELDPAKKRHPFNKGLVLLGGGVGDSYQPLENDFRLTRGALELAAEFGHPVHLLTKSTLVLRDIDLLKRINTQSKAIISFSFSSVDQKLSAIFEPGVPSPADRLNAIHQLKGHGLTCGMFLMPVIPFLTDTDQHISASVSQAKAAGADFVIFGGMTLKEGVQKDHYLARIKEYYPELLIRYNQLYPGDRWGGAAGNYYQEINTRFFRIARENRLPARMPVTLCQPYVSEDTMVYLTLEQIDYLSKLQGIKSSLGYIAYQLSQLKTPLRQLTDYSSVKGMRPPVERLIKEILSSGSCGQYKELMRC